MSTSNSRETCSPASQATYAPRERDRAPEEALRPASAPMDGSQVGPSRQPMEVSITPYRDGPYLLRGPFSLRDQDGVEIASSRRVVALCRCGKSRTRPFCDGTHRLIDFQAPSGLERATASSASDGNRNAD
jgi:CDGSH-type Zn-finger protein